MHLVSLAGSAGSALFWWTLASHSYIPFAIRKATCQSPRFYGLLAKPGSLSLSLHTWQWRRFEVDCLHVGPWPKLLSSQKLLTDWPHGILNSFFMEAVQVTMLSLEIYRGYPVGWNGMFSFEHHSCDVGCYHLLFHGRSAFFIFARETTACQRQLLCCAPS